MQKMRDAAVPRFVPFRPGPGKYWTGKQYATPQKLLRKRGEGMRRACDIAAASFPPDWHSELGPKHALPFICLAVEWLS